MHQSKWFESPANSLFSQSLQPDFSLLPTTRIALTATISSFVSFFLLLQNNDEGQRKSGTLLRSSDKETAAKTTIE
jgi:hypothetical protein